MQLFAHLNFHSWSGINIIFTWEKECSWSKLACTPIIIGNRHCAFHSSRATNFRSLQHLYIYARQRKTETGNLSVQKVAYVSVVFSNECIIGVHANFDQLHSFSQVKIILIPDQEFLPSVVDYIKQSLELRNIY
jgi:hypothetical protein